MLAHHPHRPLAQLDQIRRSSRLGSHEPHPSKSRGLRKRRGGSTGQVRYFLTSSAAPDTRIAEAVRAHWAIENGLHWVLDTDFGEDLSRVRDRNAAANLAVLRRIALNLVRADPSPGSLKGKRKRAAWDDGFMQHVVAG